MIRLIARPCLLGLVLLAIVAPASVSYGLELPAIFGDDMVLQQKQKIPVWGWAAPAQQVTATLDKQQKAATADRSGVWRLDFDPIEAGGPYTLTVKAGPETVTFRNVLVGEVWLLTGQSNMQMAVQGTLDADRAIREANNPKIRLYKSEFLYSSFPLRQSKGQWMQCNSKTVLSFSAAGYYFGEKLQKELNVPVGLINTSYGGTLAETWMSQDMLGRNADTRAALKLNIVFEQDEGKVTKKVIADLAAWQAKFHAGGQVYEDTAPAAADWAQPSYQDSAWRTVKLPATFSKLLGKPVNGVVQLRKVVEIPAACAGKELLISLGPVKDFDTVYFNGTKVGSSDKSTTSYWSIEKRYKIPAALVKAGPAVIAVRVFNSWGEGGFAGVGDQMQIFAKLGERDGAIPLSGDWRMNVERQFDAKKDVNPAGAPRALNEELKHYAAGLYNGMIYPLHPYGIRGVLWYQGEGNGWRAHNYRFLLESMIPGWRELWGQGDFPFGIAQLANNGEKTLYRPDGGEMHWAQYLAHKTLPNTGIVVTMDLMSPKNDPVDTTHYKNKRPVGERFCLWALAKVYGRNVEYSGPEYTSMTTSGREAVLSFDHVGKGLVSSAVSAQTAAMVEKLAADCGVSTAANDDAEFEVRNKLAQLNSAFTAGTARCVQNAQKKGVAEQELRTVYLNIDRLLKQHKIAEANTTADRVMTLIDRPYEPAAKSKEAMLPDRFTLLSQLDAIRAKIKGGKKNLEGALAAVEKALEQDTTQLTGFVIAGDNKEFMPAKAEIRGDKVVVWSDKLSVPKAVRYGWSGHPYVSLYNKDGLPALAFRTDNWAWVSEPRTPK